MKTAKHKIPEDVLGVFRTSKIEGNAVTLPAQLERKLYDAFKKTLGVLGGKWDRKSGTHIFPADTILEVQGIMAGDLDNVVDEKKTFQFFETPHGIVKRMIVEAGLDTGMQVLEPSAGKGAIISVLANHCEDITAYEINPKMLPDLQKVAEKWPDHAWLIEKQDFLTVKPEAKFDVVLMNPPFTQMQDVDHVEHAFKFLAPGGTLVAITSPSWTFSEYERAQRFRCWLEDLKLADDDAVEWEKLPDGTFKESGTGVSTIMLRIRKPI